MLDFLYILCYDALHARGKFLHINIVCLRVLLFTRFFFCSTQLCFVNALGFGGRISLCGEEGDEKVSKMFKTKQET